ncbi:hypothetical protein ACSMXN_23070 [Jatrophihabitans sp. DSM 45814]
MDRLGADLEPVRAGSIHERDCGATPMMRQLVVWVFPEKDEARRIETVLGRLAAQQGLTLRDGRVLNWPSDGEDPWTRRIYSVPLTDALDEIVWGLMLGAALYGDAPLPKLPEPKLPGPLVAIGMDDDALAQLRDALAPGCSGLLVLADGAHLRLLGEAFAPETPTVRVSIPDDVPAAPRDHVRRKGPNR